jgi:hypothetical protein
LERVRVGSGRDEYHATHGARTRSQRLWAATNHRFDFGQYQAGPWCGVKQVCPACGSRISIRPAGSFGRIRHKKYLDHTATKTLHDPPFLFARVSGRPFDLSIHIDDSRRINKLVQRASSNRRAYQGARTSGMGSCRWMGTVDYTLAGSVLWTDKLQ